MTAVIYPGLVESDASVQYHSYRQNNLHATIYYAWTLLVILLYLGSAELAKRWFYKRMAKFKTGK